MIGHRLQRQQAGDQARWIAQAKDLMQIYELLLEQQAQLIAEQQLLLEDQRDLLRTMLDNEHNARQ